MNIFKHNYKTIIILSSILTLCSNFTLISKNKRKLIEISKEYTSYKQYLDIETIVTDSSRYKWTIELCSRPANMDLGYHFKIDSSFISSADSVKSPHGNKLYRLYVKEYGDYLRNAPVGQPMGQVIVKETWNVQEIKYDSLNKSIQIQSKNNGKWYKPTKVSELFIMYKEEQNKNNDQGWIYGIVSIEDKTADPIVLNNVKTSSCIGCHSKTKYDRIFGVK